MVRSIICALVMIVVTAGAAAGQQTAPVSPAAPAQVVPQTQGAAPQPPVAGPVSPAEQPQGFTYNAEGRRDPFVSLLRRGGDSGSPLGQRPAGLSGLLSSEVSLRGVIQGQTGFVGMLLGVDQKTYIVRAGDMLCVLGRGGQQPASHAFA